MKYTVKPLFSVLLTCLFLNTHAQTFCDSLNTQVSNYDSTNPGGANFFSFIAALDSSLGTQHYDSVSGQMKGNDEIYWFAMLKSCGISCPSIINCTTVNTLLSSFEALYPQYDSAAPGFIWGNYLDQNGGGMDYQGNTWWYSADQWTGLLTCCNITAPIPAALGSHCDSIQATLASLQGLGTTNFNQYDFMASCDDLFGESDTHYDSASGLYLPNTFLYWYSQIQACGDSCSQLISCDSISIAISQLSSYQIIPDSSGSYSLPFIEAYLGLRFPNYQFDSPTWATLLHCCNPPYINYNDSVAGHCDTTELVRFAIQYYLPSIVPSIDSCMPDWVYNFMITDVDLGSDSNIYQLCNDLISCNIQCLPYCPTTLTTTCDSTNSMNYLYRQLLAAEQNGTGIPAADPDLLYESYFILYGQGPSYFPQLISQMLTCDSNDCIGVNMPMLFMSSVFSSYGVCLPERVFTTSMNMITERNYSYLQWCSQFAYCGDTCPSICDSAYTFCDSVREAGDFTNRYIVYNDTLVDTAYTTSLIFTTYFGRYISASQADSMLFQCSPLCDSFVAATSVNSDSICNGTIATLSATSAVSYQWNTGDSTSSISESTGGTYSVTVTSSSGCTASAAGMIFVKSNPVPLLTVSVICSGAIPTFTASGGINYLWNTGATTSIITDSVPGTYTVTVTNSAGCSAIATATDTALVTPSFAINSPSVCSGDTATLTAIGGSSYAWSTGDSISSIRTPISGTYTVTATNVSGCTASASGIVTVISNPSPTVSISSDTICAGVVDTLTAAGGTGYLWSTGDTTAMINETAGGSYTVTVSNSSGCKAAASGIVTVNPIPNLSVNSPSIYPGDTAVLTATGGVSYSWSTGDTSATIRSTSAGTYTVTAINAVGCNAIAQSWVTVNNIPPPSLTFEKNLGQFNNDTILYQANSGNVLYRFLPNGISFAKIQNDTIVDSTYILVWNMKLAGFDSSATVSGDSLGMDTLVTASGSTFINNTNIGGLINYYIGNDTNNWHTDVPTYNALTYNNVYNNINLKYFAANNRGNLEYDFIVNPGGHIGDIKMQYSGVDSIHINLTGNANIATQMGLVTEIHPTAYQMISGSIVNVPITFIEDSTGTLGFLVTGTYDTTHPLVIDPCIQVWSTYWANPTSNSSNNTINAMGADNTGVYIGGFLTGSNIYANYGSPIPVSSGFYSLYNVTNTTSGITYAFISKFNLTATQKIFTTIFGGTSSITNSFHNIALGFNEYNSVFDLKTDPNYVYVCGSTQTNNFPQYSSFSLGGVANLLGYNATTASNIYGDAFLGVFNSSNGQAQYINTFGGSENDVALKLALGNTTPPKVYTTGFTESSIFAPTTLTFSLYNSSSSPSSTNEDIFMVELDPFNTTGTLSNTLLSGLIWGSNSSSLSPTSTINMDWGHDILFNTNNSEVYVTGFVNIVTGFPVTSGATAPHGNPSSPAYVNRDGFLTVLTPVSGNQASIDYSTALGGADADDEIFSMDIDHTSNSLYLLGITQQGVPLNVSNTPITTPLTATSGTISSHSPYPLTYPWSQPILVGNSVSGGNGNVSGYIWKLNASTFATIASTYVDYEVAGGSSGTNGVNYNGGGFTQGVPFSIGSYVYGDDNSWGGLHIGQSTGNVYITSLNYSTQTNPTPTSCTPQGSYGDCRIFALNSTLSSILFSSQFGSGISGSSNSQAADQLVQPYILESTSSDIYTGCTIESGGLGEIFPTTGPYTVMEPQISSPGVVGLNLSVSLHLSYTPTTSTSTPVINVSVPICQASINNGDDEIFNVPNASGIGNTTGIQYSWSYNGSTMTPGQVGRNTYLSEGQTNGADNGIFALHSISPSIYGYGTSATYTVTITETVPSNCPLEIVNFNVTIPSSGTTSIVPPTGCLGSQITCNTSALIGSTPGPGNTVSWLWSTGETTQSITPTAIGTYTVTVSVNSSLCTSTASVTVSAPPTATLTANNPTSCSGSTVTLTATGGSTYEWATTGASLYTNSGCTTPYSSTSSNTLSAVYAQPTANTTYTVTVTNSSGCSATASFSVTVTPVPTASISPTPTSVCTGSSTTLTASGGSSYAWSYASATTPSISPSPTSATTYTVTVTDASTGCTASASASVSVNSLPTPTLTASPSSICSGSTLTLTAAGGSTYVWSTSSGLYTNSGCTTAYTNIASSPSILYAQPTANATYTVTATNSSGCSATATATVTVNAVPALTLSSSYTTCSPPVTLTTSISPSNTYTYQWAEGGSNISGATTYTYPATTSGTYTVTANVSGLTGCSTTASTTVSVNLPAFTITVTADNTTPCEGSDVTFTYSICKVDPTCTDPNGYTIYAEVPSPSFAGTATNGAGISNSFSTDVALGILNATDAIFATSGPTIGCATLYYTTEARNGGTYTETPTINNSFYGGGTNLTSTGGVTPVSVTINSSPAPFANAGGVFYVNECTCIELGGGPTAPNTRATGTGGSGSYTYLWSTSTSGANFYTDCSLSTVSSTIGNPYVPLPSSTPATYTVTVTDASTGCTATSTATVDIGPYTQILDGETNYDDLNDARVVSDMISDNSGDIYVVGRWTVNMYVQHNPDILRTGVDAKTGFFVAEYSPCNGVTTLDWDWESTEDLKPAVPGPYFVPYDDFCAHPYNNNVAMDANGDIISCGSGQFGVGQPPQVLITMIDPSAQTSRVATPYFEGYLQPSGGTGLVTTDIESDPDGNVYIAGYNSSTDPTSYVPLGGTQIYGGSEFVAQINTSSTTSSGLSFYWVVVPTNYAGVNSPYQYLLDGTLSLGTFNSNGPGGGGTDYVIISSGQFVDMLYGATGGPVSAGATYTTGATQDRTTRIAVDYANSQTLYLLNNNANGVQLFPIDYVTTGTTLFQPDANPVLTIIPSTTADLGYDLKLDNSSSVTSIYVVTGNQIINISTATSPWAINSTTWGNNDYIGGTYTNTSYTSPDVSALDRCLTFDNNLSTDNNIYIGGVATNHYQIEINGINPPYLPNISSSSPDVTSYGFIVRLDNSSGQYRILRVNGNDSVIATNISDNPKIAIFPNPFQDQLNLIFNVSNTDASVIVYDIMGRVVFDQKMQILNGKMETIDLSNLDDAAYEVHVQSGSESVVKKIIKIKN